MLITGAFVLHGCAFGLILVPPKYNLEPTKSYPDVRKQNDMGSIMIYSMERMNNSQFISADMKVHESILTKLKTLFDVSVLKSLSIMCFHWMLFTMGYTTIYTFLPVVSAIRGISKETVSSMLSVVGISDFIGRLCFGFTVNSKKNKSNYPTGHSMYAIWSWLHLFDVDSTYSSYICWYFCAGSFLR